MIKLTAHAQRRRCQRGIRNSRLYALLENADVERPLGGNCWLLKVSHHTARTIRGYDGLARQAAIYCESTGEVVSVLHATDTRRGRRYRKGR
ncbi:hypothetical protein [Mesorhizobium sp.]|uniref:hypothetical protein n=1 Tax=Mesorhizobium sp. TaxID=1871066 RepID=UPI000FE3A5EE|nr:hypothetical protein [Mesorhizobium sp.]RWK29813.1 MAG: hypothetical protein EOR40_26550 [Mesorhizobium sp.]RWK91051.1 MAG: hypothetical protein EOR52_05840 [Mesorhizobium sp.]TIP17927.1 MAG: hypothetical protein E5X66_18930 [Mesorhizobium sp.]TJV81328.1 MAG: hypothetical protein E5X45_16895 [Mesorhizobium sp.]TJW17203.1 MAG: hypothetical protein E5X42_16070 [Mesorhizobium sp.]